MPHPFNGAVAQWLDANLFGGYVERRRVVSVGTSAVRVLPNNPERILAVVVGLTTDTYTLDFQEGLASLTGIILPGQGATLTLLYLEDGPLCTREWQGICSAVGGSLFVLEALREQPSMPQAGGP